MLLKQDPDMGIFLKLIFYFLKNIHSVEHMEIFDV